MWIISGVGVQGFKLTQGIPQASSYISEANGTSYPATVEFVHIHKAGGTTFNTILLPLVCPASEARQNHSNPIAAYARASRHCFGEQMNLTQLRERKEPYCCLNRPVIGMEVAYSAFIAKFREAPRYINAREEFSGFVMPWIPGATFKAVLLREPYSLWVSTQLYNCRRFYDGLTSVGEPDMMRKAINAMRLSGNHSAIPEDEILGKYYRQAIVRNRQAMAVIPQAILQGKHLTAEPLSVHDLAKAERVVSAFGFVGLTEEFTLSVCLLARTLLSATDVCRLCCRGGQHIPPQNAVSPELDQKCRSELNLTKDDHRLVQQVQQFHTLDAQVYKLGSEIFRKRVKAAADEGWGNTEAGCNCSFYSFEQPASVHSKLHWQWAEMMRHQQ